jgi:glycerophosphoryl diester phosphodiesterase
MDVQSEHPFADDLTPRYVQAIHARQRRVFTYTVNEAADMRRLFEMGVDGIFTDDPALALGIRSRQNS